MSKPKVAFYWCASCGGCEESLVDIADALLDIASIVDFAIFPVAMDFKKSDVEALADGEIAVAMINGSVRTSEQEEMAKLLRRKSQVVVAYGSCAQMGGIPSLANLFTKEQVLRYVYHDAPTVQNPDGTEPQTRTEEEGRVATLPAFFEEVRSLDQVIEVDYSIPGCAPNPELVLSGISSLLSGDPPPKGTVLAPDYALCRQCPRLESKPATLTIKEFRRPHLHAVDPDVCMLAQGFLCMGPATRSGCGEKCIRGNMPCTGCFGPLSSVRDQGAKALSSIASLVDADTDEAIDSILKGIPDPAGTLYRYGVAKSFLRRKADQPVGAPS